jgi:Xaa-Pro aminopeptidase
VITKKEFKQRRSKVLNYLKDCSDCDDTKYKAVFYSGERKVFSNDVKYPFRVDSNFYYLTGFTEPNSIAVLDPFSDNPFQLYVEDIDPLHSIWEGHREGIAGAKTNFNADAAYEKEEFKDKHEPGSNKNSSTTTDSADFVHTLRTIKSNAELDLMRKSSLIAVQAHRVAKEIITPGIYEYEVEAVINQVFRSKGASGWAYPAIVASGINSCILHYTDNNKIIEKNDLILIDAGCEYEYYASDITRVHHASNSMSQEQKDIYDIVVTAQKSSNRNH